MLCKAACFVGMCRRWSRKDYLYPVPPLPPLQHRRPLRRLHTTHPLAHAHAPHAQVAIKKVLQDKRFKNRELQIMKMLSHPNVVQLKHHFYTTTDKEEVYLNLVRRRNALLQALHCTELHSGVCARVPGNVVAHDCMHDAWGQVATLGASRRAGGRAAIL